MHPLEKKIGKIVGGGNMIARGETLVVGVSGGPDSIALLNVLARLAPELEIRLIAAYLDHGLRPLETPREREYVQAEAQKTGAGFAEGSVDVRGFADRTKVSIEEGARELRYQFLRRVADTHMATKIAVAHHADDQAEEILLRMLRGAGKKGLSGMEAVHENWLIRPFLGVSKKEILEYLASKQILFCHDSSNSDRGCLRNKVRLDLLPYLAAHYHPGIKKILRQTAAIFHAEDDLLAAMVDSVYGSMVEDGQSVRLSLSDFCLQHMAIQRRIVEKILISMANHPGFRQIEQTVQLARTGTPGSQIHLADGLRGRVEAAHLIFSYPAGRINLRGDLYARGAVPFEVEIAGPGIFTLDGERCVEVEVVNERPGLEDFSREGTDYLDAATISFPLKCRSRAPGDRFWPLGSNGSKKVGEFLTNGKIAEEERNRVVVVESEARIVALLGLRVDHFCRIRPSTNACIRLTIHDAPPAP